MFRIPYFQYLLRKNNTTEIYKNVNHIISAFSKYPEIVAENISTEILFFYVTDAGVREATLIRNRKAKARIFDIMNIFT